MVRCLCHVLTLLLVLLATGCEEAARVGSSGESPPERAVLVLAASSTTDAVSDVAAAYEKRTGSRVTITTAGSNALANQIIAGVPGDVFLSANEKWAETVEHQGLAVKSKPLLSNRLVLVVPLGNPGGVAGPNDLVAEGVERVALAGENVPAGMYAEQALRQANVYEQLTESNRVARGHDVRRTLGFVETGEAEAGIVFATDARASDRVDVVFTFPVESHDVIVYPLVLLKSDNEAAASQFFDFLFTLEAMAILEKRGFVPAASDGQGAE